MKRQSYFNQLLNAPASSSAPVLRPPRVLFRTNAGSADLQMPALSARPPVRPSPNPAAKIPEIAKDPPQSEIGPTLVIAPATAEPKPKQAPQQPAPPMLEASAGPMTYPETLAPEPSSPREPQRRTQPKSEIRSRPAATEAATETAAVNRPATVEPATAAARRQMVASPEPGGGLRIGTLEVRVTAPPPAPAQTKPSKPPPPRRAAPQSIARPFPAFGLRQS